MGTPSQWGLQYLLPFAAGQLHPGRAHFLDFLSAMTASLPFTTSSMSQMKWPMVSCDSFPEAQTPHAISNVIQITFLDLNHPFAMEFGNWAARFCHRRSGMLECFLLLRQSAKWPALVAIPAVLAGGVASICLMLSGIKGLITEGSRPKRRVQRAVSPQRVVKWIGKRPQLRSAGQQ